MDARVGRVLELLRQDEAFRVRGDQLLGALDGAVHALFAGREFQVGAQHLQHAAALNTHRYRHGERDFVASRRSHKRQSDAGVAGGGLHDLHPGLEHAAFFGVPDHGCADAALHRISRIAALDLRQHSGFRAVCDAIELDERSSADREGVVFVNARHGYYEESLKSAS